MNAELDVAALDVLFERLLDLPRPQRRQELELLERTQPQQAQVLRRLLEVAAKADTSGLRALEAAIDDEDEAAAPEVPGYEIVREIGRGGAGTVYEAIRRVHGTEQPVAIKVLRAARLNPVEHQRFINEQRILAQLQHPNISVMLDAGTIGGRPFMVLERIAGVPLDQRLRPPASVSAVLDAVLQILDALQLAHEHFVVHRDIKPGNVLVDEEGRIKLIDFGIAKMLADVGQEGGLATQTGMAPLTLRYASPEQLLARPVGVPSDIYQVGLLMYRLLTGAWPFNEDEFQLPTLRTRADSQPIPPSRHAQDRARRRSLQGDIDSIVLRCLRFEPSERYRSAAELKDDLLRHRSHRPVAARRQTRGYLIRSFLFRHRLGAVLATALLAVILVITLGSLSLARRSQQYSSGIERILDTVTEMFTAANPYASSPATTTVAEVVARASQRFVEEDFDDPDFHAQMLLRLAEMQSAFGEHSQVLGILERAQGLPLQGGLAADLRSRIQTRLVATMVELGEYDRALAQAEQARPHLSERDRLEVDYLVSTVLSERGESDAVMRHLQPVLAQLDRLEPVLRSRVQSAVGFHYGRQGNAQKELEYHRLAAAELTAAKLDHVPALIRARANIATTLIKLGRTDTAAREYEQMLAEARGQLAMSHPMVAKVTANASVALQNVERFDDAYRVFDGLDLNTVLAEEPGWRAQFLVILASAALNSGRLAESHDALVEGVDIAVRTLGSGSPRLAYFAEQLAWNLYESGEHDLAAAAADKGFSLSKGERTVGDLVLELLSRSGHTIAGRPDPAHASRLRLDCDRIQFAALKARIVEGSQPEALPIPEDCASIERARLEVLGLLRGDPSRHPDRQALLSPLVQAWRAQAQGAAWEPPPPLDAAQRERIRALIAML